MQEFVRFALLIAMTTLNVLVITGMLFIAYTIGTHAAAFFGFSVYGAFFLNISIFTVLVGTWFLCFHSLAKSNERRQRLR
jgi:hypothetical protein